MRRRRWPLALWFPRIAASASLGLIVVSGAHAEVAPRDDAHRRFLREARQLMLELSPESRRDAERIRDAYLSLAPATFRDHEAIGSALSSGRLSRLPKDAERFAVRPRMVGPSPIGEKDLSNQASYLAAHPGALGCLLHIAARVGTPVEVTSLVRHLEYQRLLQRTNPNARTQLPVHAIGLAFDISILNMPLSTARTLRDVLRRMRSDGDLFFIAETRQLVFHVVPTPQRLSFYSELFEGLVALPPRRGEWIARASARAGEHPRVYEPPALESTAPRIPPWWPLGLVGFGIVWRRAIRHRAVPASSWTARLGGPSSSGSVTNAGCEQCR